MSVGLNQLRRSLATAAVLETVQCGVDSDDPVLEPPVVHASIILDHSCDHGGNVHYVDSLLAIGVDESRWLNTHLSRTTSNKAQQLYAQNHHAGQGDRYYQGEGFFGISKLIMYPVL